MVNYSVVINFFRRNENGIKKVIDVILAGIGENIAY